MDGPEAVAGVQDLSGVRWIQADVFSTVPLSGNGLAVFPEAGGLADATMARLTQELRQFESIFLTDFPPGVAATGQVTARIFTMEEELDFAGHPVLGAASVLQHLLDPVADRTWRLTLKAGEVSVRTERRPHGYWAEMDQGPARFGPDAPTEAAAPVLAGLGLGPGDLVEGLPVATVSTGLDYVIVPVTGGGLAKARIQGGDFERRLAALGGKFVYVLDVAAREGRTWDSRGLVEDIATGSAAGPAAAYLWRYGQAPDRLVVRQGRFAGRPSEIAVRRDPDSGTVLVGGDMVILAEGRFV